MGLFDGLDSALTPNLTAQQAILAISVAAVNADGQMSGDETTRLALMLTLSPIFAANTSDQNTALIKFAFNFTQQLGDEAVTRAAAVLNPEIRETAFAFACDMVFADGVVAATEGQFLNSLAQRLSIREDVGKAVVRAAVIRNRS